MRKGVFGIFLFVCLSAMICAQETIPFQLCTFGTDVGYRSCADTTSCAKNSVQPQNGGTQGIMQPWYSGTILTSSACNIDVGHVAVDPALNVRYDFSRFDQHYKVIKLTNDLLFVSPSLLIGGGLLPYLDLSLKGKIIYKNKANQHSTNWGDSVVKMGIPLVKQGPHGFAARFTISEVIPTGKYERLDPNKKGVDISGAGGYFTRLSLNFAQLVGKGSLHPCSLTASVSGTFLSSPISVHELNVYGGGVGTDGKVKGGECVEIAGSCECSITQNFVATIEACYIYQRAFTFSGNEGHGEHPNPVGLPFRDAFWIAPSLQYSYSENLGCTLGATFPVVGRNTTRFIEGILKVCCVW